MTLNTTYYILSTMPTKRVIKERQESDDFNGRAFLEIFRTMFFNLQVLNEKLNERIDELATVLNQSKECIQIHAMTIK